MCQCYIRGKSQLLVLGKSFSGAGKRLVLTSGDFERPFLLTNSEDVMCCLLEDHLIVASYATNCVRIWSRDQDGGVEDYKLVPISETGIQVKLLKDNLYILTKSGVVSVFNVVYYRSVKQVRRFHTYYILARYIFQINPPQDSRVQIIDVCPGLLAAGTSEKSVLVWSLAENKIVHKLRGNGHVATCLVLARRIFSYSPSSVIGLAIVSDI